MPRKAKPWMSANCQASNEEKTNFKALYYRLWMLVGADVLQNPDDFTLNCRSSTNFIISTSSEKLSSLQTTYPSFLTLEEEYRNHLFKGEALTTAATDNFMSKISRTEVFSFVYNALSPFPPATGITTFPQFVTSVRNLWFGNGPPTSDCLFRHIFIGEVDGVRGTVSGKHFYLGFEADQKAQKIQYNKIHTWFGLCPLTQSYGPRVANVGFNWEVCGANYTKQQSSFFLGTSPDFDISIYTCCAFKGQPSYSCENGFERIEIQVHRDTAGNVKTMYPVATTLTPIV